MKQLIPILALSTLTAATFADAPAPAVSAPEPLAYNRIGVSRSGQDTTIEASALLGSSNFLVTLSTAYAGGYYGYNNNSNGGLIRTYAFINFGYVFRNIYAGVDATLHLGAGSQNVSTAYGITLRRSLNELLSGLEASVSYSQMNFDPSYYNYNNNGYTLSRIASTTCELSYNINKQVSVAYALTTNNGGDNYYYYYANNSTNAISLRYNY